MNNRIVVIMSLFSTFVSQSTGHFRAKRMSDNCLQLICMASTGCDVSRRCLGSGNARCGPFEISLNYWKVSGSPGQSFHSCAFDMKCSQKSVINYMTQEARDCNGDGLIDCADYAAIHRAGPAHCSDRWVSESVFMKSIISSVDDGEASERVTTMIPHMDFTRVVREDHPNRNAEVTHHSIRTSPRREILHNIDEVTRRILANIPNIGVRATGSYTTTRPVYTTRGTVRLRPTRPQRNQSPTRRRLVTSPSNSNTVTLPPPASSPSIPNPVEDAGIPWWRLATTTARPVRMSTRSSVTITEATTPRRVTRTTSTTTTSRAPVVTAAASTSTTRRTTITTTTSTTTTRAPKTKPTFNPIRASTGITLANDVEPSQDSPVKSNRTITEVELSNACLECICIGSSGCNFDAKSQCHGEDECGPYRIDYAYWYEAGFPGYKGSDEDFIRCAKDRTCAEKAVRTYVKNNAKDCNKDGVIDCMDYASIHKAGPELCDMDWMFESKFWDGFTQCYGFEEKEMFRKRK